MSHGQISSLSADCKRILEGPCYSRATRLHIKEIDNGSHGDFRTVRLYHTSGPSRCSLFLLQLLPGPHKYVTQWACGLCINLRAPSMYIMPTLGPITLEIQIAQGRHYLYTLDPKVSVICILVTMQRRPSLPTPKGPRTQIEGMYPKP